MVTTYVDATIIITYYQVNSSRQFSEYPPCLSGSKTVHFLFIGVSTECYLGNVSPENLGNAINKRVSLHRLPYYHPRQTLTWLIFYLDS